MIVLMEENPLLPSATLVAFDENATIVVRKAALAYGQPNPLTVQNALQVSNTYQQCESLAKRNENYAKQIATVKNLLTEALDEKDLDADLAESIASALNITLTRTVKVRGTISFTATLSMPYSTDPEDAMGDLKATIESDDYDVDVDDYRSDIDDVEEV